MYSVRTAYEITGSVPLYDRLERMAFNALPATTDQLFAGNAYYHRVNQMHLSGKDGYEINGCCTGNVHQVGLICTRILITKRARMLCTV